MSQGVKKVVVYFENGKRVELSQESWLWDINLKKIGHKSHTQKVITLTGYGGMVKKRKKK